MTRTPHLLLPAVLLFFGCPPPAAEEPDDDVFTVERALLGKLLYFDAGLSTPAGQSCASCHSPDAGFADPHQQVPVSEGVIPGRFGNRNSPSSAYASFSPPLHWDEVHEVYEGGQFWDGRADSLADQAMGPFLAGLEMNNPDRDAVVDALSTSDYADLFELAWGEGALDNTAQAYRQIAVSIAAWEASPEVNRFSSKFDAWRRGAAELSAQEARGFELFEREDKGNCAACHLVEDEDGGPGVFTDFTYDNLGVPKNPDNPFYGLSAEWNPEGEDFVDIGLGGTLDDPEQDGKFKVPTLRNIALTAPYMHNGVFDTLEEVVSFYNTRDVGDWDPPEVASNVNTDELGDLGLTEQEEADIVAFMRTLTDGWFEP